WQKPGQQNVAQELIKIIINYVAELRIIKLIFIDYLTFKLEIKYILQTIHFFTYETSLKEIQWQDTKNIAFPL
ncbi:hypothetical protein, partial [Phocaeicola vulgatus]|uniref:hypothetical protein n=1 Tax=Phocaeicola vulgatus TaxID=821 RepID=UPI001E4580A8